MQYLKFTYVDALTGVSVALEPAMNGAKLPDVPGLVFVWARESAYPTKVPEFFGTCPPTSLTQANGVLGIYSQTDWEQMRVDEENAKGVSRSAMTKKIDAAVLAIYDKPTTLSKEYEAREKAAADYKAAGYTGTVPARLAGFATPSGMTATAAADLILSQSAQMRGALDSLSDLRMRKYEVQRATTDAAARTVHAAIMAQIAAIAAVLG